MMIMMMMIMMMMMIGSDLAGSDPQTFFIRNKERQEKLIM